MCEEYPVSMESSRLLSLSLSFYFLFYFFIVSYIYIMETLNSSSTKSNQIKCVWMHYWAITPLAVGHSPANDSFHKAAEMVYCQIKNQLAESIVIMGPSP
jgi:hypothetical protein